MRTFIRKISNLADFQSGQIRRTVLLGALILLVGVISSCDNPTEGPQNIIDTDELKPVVSITSPGSSNYFKGTINIAGSASDNMQLMSVKILVDNAVIKEFTPAALSYEVDEQWDTKTVEDGTHTIEITATDLQGNTQSASVEVNIMNYFFKFSIIEHVINETHWFFLSKADGTILASAKAPSPNEPAKFETPDGFDPSQTFIITHYRQLADGNNFEDKIKTYVGFPAGAYTLRPPGIRNIAGDGTFIIKNTPFQPGISHPGIVDIYSVETKGDSTSGTFRIENSQSDVLFAVRLADQRPRYQTLDNVKDNDVLRLDYETMTPFDSIATSIIGGPVDYSYTRTAVAPPAGKGYYYESLASEYFDNLEPVNQPVLYVPGAAYSEYMFFVTHGVYDQYTNNYFLRAAEPPAQVKVTAVDLVDFSIADATINIQASGSYDVQEAYGVHYESGEQFHNSVWTIYFPQGANSIIKLSFPPALIEECHPISPEDHQFKIKFTEGIDYTDYITLPFNLDEQLYDLVSEYTTKEYMIQ